MVPKIPADEREQIRAELLDTAERLVKKYKLTIPESRKVIEDILSCSI
jgi:hypothetical protein